MSLPIFDIVRNEAANVYAIIDVSRFDGCMAYWKTLYRQCQEEWRLLHNDYGVQCYPVTELLLLSIKEGSATESLLLWLLSHRQYPNTGVVLLTATAEIDDIQQVCLPRYTCVYPDGRHVFFPFHEPALLKNWLTTTDVSTRQQFESPFGEIYTPEIVGTCYSNSQFECISTSISPRNIPLHVYENRLSVEAYRVLTNQARYQYLTKALFVRASEYYPFLLDITWLEQRFISGIFLASEFYPAASEDEWESWSAHRWIIGSDYYQHPQFIKLVSHYSLSIAIKKFKMDAALVSDSRTHFHRREWMFGLADDKGA
ncbi:DUF4123 domain-containing protein [Aeromonas hydrophila]|uniref:DUF4123 domain-containing protein n=1 Tax=Aeromonas hydrophila TaxID=644 RepID=UPI00191ED42E|nr:DUF4123 domain-containing protein [Aeromonas hydrophila]MBL0561311.1 DUF4123 domain-containing protein [Aeromonas hydrophila]